MTDPRLDLRNVPRPERHPQGRDASAVVPPVEELTPVTDRDPKPGFREPRAGGDAVDAEGLDAGKWGPTAQVAVHQTEPE